MLLNGAWESKVDIYNVFELRCKTTAYFGIGAIKKFKDICEFLNKKDMKKILILTDEVVYNVTGIKEKVEKFLGEAGIEYIVYYGIKPNPNVKMIDEAKKMGLDFGAKAVIGIGGGSHIDTAKSVAVLLHEKYKNYTGSDLYELKFIPEEALPIIAINTTHGTGTEVDRFAVATIEEKGYKPAIAYDSIYPIFAIDDPEITKSLPWSQTTYTAIDAINHVTEAATTLAASPYSILLAKETIRLVSKYLPQAQAKPGDLTARYFLLYASTIAGISFDNGLLHFTHALEHPLSGIRPDLPHGLGLAMLLPAVVKAIYSAQAEVLAEIYSPIVPGLKGVPGEAEEAAKGIEKWLFNIGVTQKLTDEGFKESDIDKLVELAFNTPSLDLLLSLAPVKATKEIVKQIYMDSLYPLNK
ncbi:alcohol dehydrogenase [Marinitoga sp. 1137]|uniref:iron-containing alcohol dehydrogenase n=1 Tax=Marinitoga sp. 1137 TaxID=1545835 RepID=UPI00095071DC|nr:iron-containing alcohol dehydrogenase [Marinitoga sp. 1137]APT75410.1 alcohol dehydrogenase [Marinitoga sp. 1137]